MTGSRKPDRRKKSCIATSCARATGPKPASRKLRAAPIVGLGFRRVAQPLCQVCELHVCGARFLEGKACLEKTARLAPKLGVHAKPSKGCKKVSVALALEEPPL